MGLNRLKPIQEIELPRAIQMLDFGPVSVRIASAFLNRSCDKDEPIQGFWLSQSIDRDIGIGKLLNKEFVVSVPLDKFINKIIGLGVPGLVLVVAVATSGLAGGAALVAAFAFLGGPFGMIGGIALLGILTLISDAISEYGIEIILKKVVKGLKKKGMTVNNIKAKIKSYPISNSLKLKILAMLDDEK